MCVSIISIERNKNVDEMSKEGLILVHDHWIQAKEEIKHEPRF